MEDRPRVTGGHCREGSSDEGGKRWGAIFEQGGGYILEIVKFRGVVHLEDQLLPRHPDEWQDVHELESKVRLEGV